MEWVGIVGNKAMIITVCDQERAFPEDQTSLYTLGYYDSL